jgi:hypothetical protein
MITLQPKRQPEFSLNEIHLSNGELIYIGNIKTRVRVFASINPYGWNVINFPTLSITLSFPLKLSDCPSSSTVYCLSQKE